VKFGQEKGEKPKRQKTLKIDFAKVSPVKPEPEVETPARQRVRELKVKRLKVTKWVYKEDPTESRLFHTGSFVAEEIPEFNPKEVDINTFKLLMNHP